VNSGVTDPIEIKTATGSRTQNWFFPGKQDCLTCHTPASGGVLGVNTRQLNGKFKYPNGSFDNQLRVLGHLGIFDSAFDERKIFRAPKLVNITNTSAALELRVRSYLDANCAMCHRPGGAGAFFDARFDTPLKKQNFINGPVANQLGIGGAKVVAPSDTNKSILFRRISIVGENQMPPLARNLVDTNATSAIGKWISSLHATTAPLPKGWSNADIGNVGVSGEASFLNGRFNLLASGSDIWESSDSFHFASKPLNGDGTIVARIVSMQYTDPWAKAGVMFRENNFPGAKYVFLGLTGQGGSLLQSRDVADGSTVSIDGPEAKPPHWLKLTRNGDVFTGQISADGTNWISAGSITNALKKNVQAGLAVTAHNNAVLNSTLFESVNVLATPAREENRPATARPSR
jgi:regulation of enolase protein 1 (concanavalin A-like superfamily)/mono/diheme cytochrome c family protein